MTALLKLLRIFLWWVHQALFFFFFESFAMVVRNITQSLDGSTTTITQPAHKERHHHVAQATVLSSGYNDPKTKESRLVGQSLCVPNSRKHLTSTTHERHTWIKDGNKGLGTSSISVVASHFAGRGTWHPSSAWWLSHPTSTTHATHKSYTWWCSTERRSV